MKFLVLALCVCAASAASFGAYKPWQQSQKVKSVTIAPAPYKPVEYVAPTQAKAVAQVAYNPVEYVAPGQAKAVAQVAYNPVGYVAPVQAVKPVVAAVKTAYKKDEEAGTIRSDSEVNADGFNYFFETTNGIAAQSSGVLKRVDDQEVIAIQGSYQYIAPDGTPVLVSYVADENGYQPKSDLLPVAPPVPEAIARSLEYLRVNAKNTEN